MSANAVKIVLKKDNTKDRDVKIRDRKTVMKKYQIL